MARLIFYQLLFLSSLPLVICCRCWWWWRTKWGFVILLGPGGARVGAVVSVVSLLDGGLMICCRCWRRGHCGCCYCCCRKVRVSGGCGWWFVTLIWVVEDKDLLWLRVVEGNKSVCTYVLVVIVGCDRRWFRIVDRSVGLMCRSSRWWVCRCDWLRHRCWKSLSLMMNSADEQFFFVIRTVRFFFLFFRSI